MRPLDQSIHFESFFRAGGKNRANRPDSTEGLRQMEKLGNCNAVCAISEPLQEWTHFNTLGEHQTNESHARVRRTTNQERNANRLGT